MRLLWANTTPEVPMVVNAIPSRITPVPTAALPGVAGAEVSHEKGTAVVTLTEAVADDVLKKAVEDQDYKVTSIQ